MRQTRYAALLIVLSAACAIGCVLSGVIVLIGSRVEPSSTPTSAIRDLAVKNLSNVQSLVDAYKRRLMTTRDAPWQLFHGLIARGEDYKISGSDGDRSCLNWLLEEAAWQPLFQSTPLARVGQYGPSFTEGNSSFLFEDHFAQFLYILMECGLDPLTTTVRLSPHGDCASLLDFVFTAEKECHEFADLSWALPVFAKWGPHTEWTNRFGSTFSVQRLFIQHIRRHTRACRGTHWCTGLVLGMRYGKQQLPKSLLLRGQERLQQCIVQAHTNQEESGFFKLEWLPDSGISIRSLPAGSESTVDRLCHQGHMIEWLMLALSDVELAHEEWPHLGVRYLMQELRGGSPKLDYGAYSHCIHALRCYEYRCEKLIDFSGSARAQFISPESTPVLFLPHVISRFR